MCEPVMTHWALPVAMDWTLLPAPIIAKAWTDSAYLSALLADPDTILRQDIKRWPWNISFTLHQDASGNRHLPLPYYKTELQAMSSTDLLTLLNQEIGGDNTLEYTLPAPVIAKAFLDSTFKSSLLSNANSALASMGYYVGYATFHVHENTATNYHLTIPSNPLSQQSLSFDALVSRLHDVYGFSSTKCCASGTCDDDWP